MLRTSTTLLVLCCVVLCAGCQSKAIPQVHVVEVWEQGTPQPDDPPLYAKGFQVIYRQIVFTSDGTYVLHETTQKGMVKQLVRTAGLWINSSSDRGPLIERNGEYVSILDLYVHKAEDSRGLFLNLDSDIDQWPPPSRVLRRVYKAGQASWQASVEQIELLIAEIERLKAIAGPDLSDDEQEALRGAINRMAQSASSLSMFLDMRAKFNRASDQNSMQYRRLLAESLVHTGSEMKALEIVTSLLERDPTDLDFCMAAGLAHLSLYQKTGEHEHYENAMLELSSIIKYYNTRYEKPHVYWRAWLHVFQLLETAGGEHAARIPQRARMLVRVDDNFGDVGLADSFIAIIERNGGFDRAQPQPAE